MPAISIIVPIYKVEKYLKRCLDSILAQTFLDYECILVDDGSPDNCPAICDECAAKDKRFRVIHKAQNEGLPKARKTGLENASGKYVIYIDGDDWIEDTMLQAIYEQAISGNYDIVSAGISCDGFPQGFNHTIVEMNNLGKIKTLKTMIRCNNWNVFGKLIKRELFFGLKFPEFQNAEDAVITLQLAYHADKISFSPLKYYHYCYNNSSISFLYTVVRKNQEAYNNFKTIIEFFEEKLGKEIYLLEPELSDKINYLKYALIRYADIKTQRDILELYPQSKDFIFKGSLPVFIKCILYLCTNNIFTPVKILNRIKPVKTT
jgi:glycosyltransferase involved in cell wall biosynthesis